LHARIAIPAQLLGMNAAPRAGTAKSKPTGVGRVGRIPSNRYPPVRPRVEDKRDDPGDALWSREHRGV